MSEKILLGNYRQISFTVIACKIIEAFVRTEIENFLFKFNLLSKQQHGFVKNKSCTTNLFETLDFFSSSLDKGCPVDVIILDFAKAFDTDKRLLLKLSCYGISGLTLKRIEAFLSNSRQRVILVESVTTWSDIFISVHQGSVIGSLLFVLYIKNLPEILRNTIKLYSDNTKIMSKITSCESS